MMHTNGYVDAFARSSLQLWKQWNAPGYRRQRNLTAAITAAVSPFMRVPRIEYAVISGYGVFQASTWTFICNSKYIDGTAAGKHGDRISWNKFKEVVCTLYHETRHAEQVYRVAQALHLKKIEMPTGGSASPIIRSGVGMPALSKVGRKELKRKKGLFKGYRTSRDLARTLGIPRSVAKHAINCSSNATHGFTAFATSATLDWVDETLFGTEPKWQLATEEWLEEEHRASRGKFMEAGESGDAIVTSIFGNNAHRDGVVEHLYFNALKCEVDSFAVEKLVKARLQTLNPIANDVLRDSLASIIP